MPVYTFENRDTKERFDLTMPWSELETWLSDNPNYKQVFRFPGYVDPVSVGVTKTDDGFKDALREVKKNHARNTINV